jgi:hypothetical protein
MTRISGGKHQRHPAADRQKTADEFPEAAAPDADNGIPDQYSQNQRSSHSRQHHLARFHPEAGEYRNIFQI